MKVNKDELKESLTLEDVFSLVEELGGEPVLYDDYIVSRTICHGGHQKKLYYYDNTKLFRCYTECSDSFDIYQLVGKIKSRETGKKWGLPQSLAFIASFYGYSEKNIDFEEEDTPEAIQDWDFFKRYDRINTEPLTKKVQMKIYEDSVLQHLPHPKIASWEQEGISPSVMKHRGICFDPISYSIIIPHYDINNNLVGIRQRTQIEEDEIYGKYKPAFLGGKLYSHPLSFNLYNLNNSKENIRTIKKAIVGEGEKFCLTYASYFGEENDITVACCGSSLITYQVQLLLSLGVEEIIVAFDKQFQKIGDEEFLRWKKKLVDINKKYSPYVNISFMFDKWGLLGYKDSPIDRGKEIFLTLFERRIIL